MYLLAFELADVLELDNREGCVANSKQTSFELSMRIVVGSYVSFRGLDSTEMMSE